MAKFIDLFKSLLGGSQPEPKQDDENDTIICVPQNRRCVYKSLEAYVLENYDGGERDSYSYIYLNDVVQYNVRFRDCLRKNGLDGVIEMMIGECPSLANEEKMLNNLREWWTSRMHERIADYDLMCMPCDTALAIGNGKFMGLDDVNEHVESVINTKYLNSRFGCYHTYESHKTNEWGIHVGKLYEPYPVFDSYDLSDNRTYDNFIFREHPITEECLRAVAAISPAMNDCRVHEDIPADMLPILYHDGDHDYMLVATQ